MRLATPVVLWLAATLCPCLPGQWLEPGCRDLHAATGSQNGDLFGWWVRTVDDVDSDGVTDFAAASPFWDLSIQQGSVGRVSMHSGADGSEIWSRNGTLQSTIFGFSLEVAGDFDGDGVRDVMAGAPYNNTAGGFLLLLSGKTGQTIHTFAGANHLDSLGHSSASGGDFDGDGVDDIAIGATGVDVAGPNAGSVYVYSGNGFGLILQMNPGAGRSRFGTVLEFLGDLNGDGRDELLVGLRDQNDSTQGRLHAMSFDGTAAAPLYTITGIDLAGELDGDHVHAGPDMNSDGVPDLFVGENFVGQARVFSGADGALLRTLTDPVDKLNWGRIVDDLNDDGVPDVLVGARGSNVGGSFAGKLFVFSGRDGRVLRTMTCTVPQSSFGVSSAIVEDLDHDGAVEIVVGASAGSQWGRGRVFVMAGEPCLAGWQNYGAGLAGTLGVPSLTSDADPVLGSVPRLLLGSSTGAATNGALVLGFAAAAIPTPWGGTLLVQPGLSLPVAVAGAGVALPIGIPDDASLCAVDLFVQALEIDSGAANGVSESAGLRLSLGQ